MIELQTVTTKAKNPSTNEFQDVTWGGINVQSTSGTTNYNNLTNKPTINGVTVQGSLTTGDLLITAADVGALPSGTKYGADFALSIDSQTFVVTAQLKDQDGNNLGQAKTIDLPLETMVVSGSYDDTTQKIILTLKNGQTVEFSVADLVSGLQSEITLNNKLDADLVSDVSSENKFVTTAEKTAWNGKQDTISDLSTIRSGAAAGATAVQPTDMNTALAAKQDTLTFDTVPTENSQNPVTSGGVAASQAAQDAEIAVIANAGAKNLASKNSGSGTNSVAISKTPITLPIGDYICSFSASNYSGNAAFELWDASNSQQYVKELTVAGSNSFKFTVTGDMSVAKYSLYVNNATISDFMICPAAITDPTYEPYALSNPVLTPAAIKAVDEGAKNKYPPFETQSSRGSTGVTYSYTNGIVHATGTKSGSLNYIEVVENRPISELGFSVGDTLILFNTSDSLLLTIILGDGTTFDPATTVGNETKELTIGAGKTHIYIRSQVLASVTGAIDLSATPMICTKATWGVSHQFVPYALPNPTLTPAAIKAVDEGAKNLVAWDIPTVRSLNTNATWTSDDTCVKGGITYKFNTDGTIVANGTADASASKYIKLKSGFPVTKGLIASCGLPKVSQDQSKGLFQLDYQTGSGLNVYDYEISKEVDRDGTVELYITVLGGITVSNLIFRPMLCIAADWAISQKFVPYCPTNRELYESKADVSQVFGQGITLKTTDDCNNITEVGMYHALSSSNIPASNSPFTNAGFRMRVEKWYQSLSGGTTGIIQIADTFISNTNYVEKRRIYFYTGGGVGWRWTDWATTISTSMTVPTT